MPQQVRIFNSPIDWHQFGDKQIFVGEAVEEEFGYQMSVAFAQFAAGEGDDVPAPYDEVWVVTEGALTVRGDGYTVHAQKGDLVHIPEGSPGVVEADQDLELVLAAHPPRWTLAHHDWAKVRAQPRQDARPHHFPATVPTTGVSHTGNGHPMTVAFAAADDLGGSHLDMGLGRVREDAVLEFTVPHDEVVVAIDVGFTVGADGNSLGVGPGSFAYLPGGVTVTFHAYRDATLAFASHSQTTGTTAGTTAIRHAL